MAGVTVAGRSTSIFSRTTLRSTPSRTRLSQVSVSNCSAPSNFNLRSRSRIFPTPSPCRLLRRELSTLVPIHSAISAACLVSKLPSEASSSIQDAIQVALKLKLNYNGPKGVFANGRFANYLSPI